MNLIQRLALGACGFALSVTPSLAYTGEATTRDLLNHLDDNGVIITYNTDECDGTFFGAYRFRGLKRLMVLCPGETVEAVDHNTVRHETMHALQHCVNTMRDTPATDPILTAEKVIQYAEENLTRSEIESILGTYPEEHWLVELEASTGAVVFDNDNLIELFNVHCVAE